LAKKRANGDGNLRKRPSGLWELTTMIGYQPDGRRKTKSFCGKTQKEARDKAKAFMIDKAQGLDVGRAYSFSEWADIWYEGRKCSISPTTQENYTYALRVLKEQFQGREIRDIKPVDIEIMNKAEANAEEVRLMMQYPPIARHGMRTQELLAPEPKHIEPDVSVIRDDSKYLWASRRIPEAEHGAEFNRNPPRQALEPC